MKKAVSFFLLWLISFFAFPGERDTLVFSHERGFYYDTFQLELSCANPDVTIRYTANGADPSAENGNVYKSPVEIKTTTIIKAAAFKDNTLASGICVHTYIFPEDVITQPAEVEDYPNKEYPIDGRGRNLAMFDHAMVPEIVNLPAYKDSVIPALLSIPSVVVGMAPERFWEFYDGSQIQKASVEIIYPDNSFQNEQVFCGIKSHSHLSMKRSMRVLFKGEYGQKKFKSHLLKTAPLNSDNAATSFDHLVFRAGNNRSWARRPSSGEATYTRDQWYRDTQVLMSGDGARGIFAHLYVNGLYWGLYNITERPDENFLEEYYGGNDDDWISVSHSRQNSDSERFNYLKFKLINEDLSDESTYSEIENYVDLKNFCDYLIVSWYTGMKDWPQNNWWAGMGNHPPGKLKFFGWDCELSFYDNRYEYPIDSRFKSNSVRGDNIILKLWKSLKTNKEFMLYFADRVYKHFSDNGCLSPEKSITNWIKLNNSIRLAIIAESARWGDSVSKEGKTRDENWNPEVARIIRRMKVRSKSLFGELKSVGYYPKIDPPEISVKGKSKKKTIIILKNPNKKGEIVYTANGEDPRIRGGSIIKTAQVSDDDSVIVKTNTGIIRARIKYNDTWSALNEFVVILNNRSENVKLTEIMFFPDSLENIKSKNFEFLEFRNIGDEPVDVSGMQIKNAARYTFPEPTLLLPGQFYILAEDAAWFTHRYGFEPDGVFRGKLKNSGETLSVFTSGHQKLWDISYKDGKAANSVYENQGYALIARPSLKKFNPSKPGHWKISKVRGGTPGEAEK